MPTVKFVKCWAETKHHRKLISSGSILPGSVQELRLTLHPGCSSGAGVQEESPRPLLFSACTEPSTSPQEQAHLWATAALVLSKSKAGATSQDRQCVLSLVIILKHFPHKGICPTNPVLVHACSHVIRHLRSIKYCDSRKRLITTLLQVITSCRKK